MSTREEIQTKLDVLHVDLDSKLVRDPAQAEQAINAISELIAAVDAKDIQLTTESDLVDSKYPVT